MDCAILTTHVQQPIPCLFPLFFPGNLVSITTDDIYLSMFVSPLGQGRVLFISAFIVPSSVTWQEQEPSEYVRN